MAYTAQQFGDMIKTKYPDYKDIDSVKLTNDIIAKHPQYKTQIIGDLSSKILPMVEPMVQKAAETARTSTPEELSTLAQGAKEDEVKREEMKKELSPEYKQQQVVEAAKGMSPLSYLGEKVISGAVEGVKGAQEATKDQPSYLSIKPLTYAGKALAGAGMKPAEPLMNLFSAVQKFAGTPTSDEEFYEMAKQVYADNPEKVALAEQKLQELKTAQQDPSRKYAVASAEAAGGVAQLAPMVKGLKGMTPKDPSIPTARTQRIITNRVNELTKLQENNAVIRKAIESADSKGFDVKTKLAETDLLKGAVDKDGTIRTTTAIDELNDFIRPQEDVVSNTLKNEGKSVPIDQIEAKLMEGVNNSGVKGAAKLRAINEIKQEIEGLKLEAIDVNGKQEIPVSTLHEAKVDKYANIDYTNPESSRVGKSVAKSYKEMVEQNTTSADIKALNKELSGYYSMQNLLEKLNGKKVTGGRLGKYFAQTVGGLVGSSFGPIGTMVGAEAGGLVKGVQMARTFGGETGLKLKSSEAMQGALEKTQSNNLGSLKTTQSTTNIIPNTPIEPTIAPKAGKVKGGESYLKPDGTVDPVGYAKTVIERNPISVDQIKRITGELPWSEKASHGYSREVWQKALNQADEVMIMNPAKTGESSTIAFKGKFSDFKPFKTGEIPQTIYRGGKGEGTSYSTSKSVAEDFAKNRGGSVSEHTLNPNAKIINYEDIPTAQYKGINDYNMERYGSGKDLLEFQNGKLEVDYTKAENWAKQNGYDAVKFPTEGEIRVLNDKAFKTASEPSTQVTPEPIKAYHGTTTEFNKFDKNKIGSSTDTGMFGEGFYFTDNRAEALAYSRGTGIVKEVYLDMKNPYIINSAKDIPDIKVPTKTVQDLKNTAKNYSKAFTEYLKSKGYDGVIDSFTNPSAKQYVVFDTSQIKK